MFLSEFGGPSLANLGGTSLILRHAFGKAHCMPNKSFNGNREIERYQTVAHSSAVRLIGVLPNFSTNTFIVQSVVADILKRTVPLCSIKRAGQGALGWGHGVSLPLEARAFYHAAPAFGPDGKVVGSVLVVAVWLDTIYRKRSK